GVLVVEERKARIEDRDQCMECGACARNCPAAALSVKAGVGCASAIIHAWLTGGEPSCDCGEGDSCC
ncbi:MAG: 4Fe-4S binding protein, partial [Desulfuromonadales bacterium]